VLTVTIVDARLPLLLSLAIAFTNLSIISRSALMHSTPGTCCPADWDFSSGLALTPWL